MSISYELEPDMPLEAFRGILKSSGLWERRPYDEPERLERMLRNASIIVAARSSSTGAIAAITTCALIRDYLHHPPLCSTSKPAGLGSTSLPHPNLTPGMYAHHISWMCTVIGFTAGRIVLL